MTPTYEYQCSRCHNIFCVTKGMDKHANVEYCPKCQNHSHRVYTPPFLVGDTVVAEQSWKAKSEEYLDKEEG